MSYSVATCTKNEAYVGVPQSYVRSQFGCSILIVVRIALEARLVVLAGRLN